jgi:hypothetical protein
MASPVLSGAFSSSTAAKACEKSGIAQYYTSMSNAAFNMINVIVENVTGIDIAETAKNRAPAEKEEQEQGTAKAVITNNIQKTLQSDFLLLPYFISAAGSWQVLFSGIETKALFQGWFLLLLAALLMCVRKKDAYIAPVSLKYCSM